MITELKLGDVSVDVVFKDIKNVHLGVYPPTGRIRISAPSRMEIEAIRMFAISKLGWIKRQQSKLRAQERESPREYLERESHHLWGKRYLLQLETSKSAGVELDHRRITLKVPARTSAEKRARILDAWYRTELKAAAVPLIEKWQKLLGVQVARFFVQRMKTKWGGSNPSLGTIRLNLELAKKHPQCLDYIILHEMAHFLVPNHSHKFADLLDQNMPNWRAVRQRLNESPLTYTEWPQA